MPIYNPAYGSVVLLHHFNGSLQPEVGEGFAADGGVAFSDVNARFGSSLSIGGTTPGGGGANVVYSAADSALYDLGAGDFTIEGWMWFNTLPTRPRTMIRISDTADNSEYQWVSDGFGPAHSFYFFVAAAAPGDQPLNPTGVGVVAGLWWHLALCRQGDLYRAFVNGIQRAAVTTSYRRQAGLKRVYIGNSRRSFVDAHDGMVDEILIARECLYTGNFTPPSQPYASPWPAACHAWPAGLMR